MPLSRKELDESYLRTVQTTETAADLLLSCVRSISAITGTKLLHENFPDWIMDRINNAESEISHAYALCRMHAAEMHEEHKNEEVLFQKSIRESEKKCHSGVKNQRKKHHA